jgi:hypothetical protein
VSKLTWDAVGGRRYETGIDHGVLYIPDGSGAYNSGFAWNGLTKVSEKPTGATTTATYADNIKYLNLISVEQFEADISAYTYPDEWGQCDGTYEPEPGVAVGQQSRKTFGLSYRTLIGNDLTGTDYGYKIHLVYGALAAPSPRDYATVNDNPAANELTWSMTTTPVDVAGHKPTATITIDSTKVDATALATLEDFLYGTTGTDPSLPTPAAVLAIFSGTVTTVTPTEPTYNSSTHVITIPTVTGITYYIDDVVVTGTVTLTTGQTKLVVAEPNDGYKFPTPTDNDWLFTY